MLFQSDLGCSDEGAWGQGGKLMKMIAGVGDAYLRTADHAGPQAFSKDDGDDESLVGVLVGPAALVVVAMNTKADSYNDVTCEVGVDNHWQFHEHTIDNLEVFLPGESWQGASLQVKEVGHDGDLEDLQDGASASVGDASVKFSDVEFEGSGSHVLARIFVVTKQ
jgi:hypothetical protein